MRSLGGTLPPKPSVEPLLGHETCEGWADMGVGHYAKPGGTLPPWPSVDPPYRATKRGKGGPKWVRAPLANALEQLRHISSRSNLSETLRYRPLWRTSSRPPGGTTLWII